MTESGMASSLAGLVAAFEAGTLPKSEFTHSAHLSVACWYLSRLEEAAAIDRLREGIRHYNECVGTPNTDTGGYHETLTIFWARVVARFLARTPAELSVDEKARVVVNEYSNRRDLWKDYYAFQVPKSVHARRRWMEPDRAL
ncbi:MAG: hypothetical protein ABIZ80_12980 [Bryobacteraceae bacterium]